MPIHEDREKNAPLTSNICSKQLIKLNEIWVGIYQLFLLFRHVIHNGLDIKCMFQRNVPIKSIQERIIKNIKYTSA